VPQLIKFDPDHIISNRVASLAKVLAIALQAQARYPGSEAHDFVIEKGFTKNVEWQHFAYGTNIHKFYMLDGSVCNWIEDAGSWSYTDTQKGDEFVNENKTQEKSTGNETQAEYNEYFNAFI
jgi:hypothetical protein